MKKYIITIAILLMAIVTVFAMNEGVTGAQFLKIMVGGKATALGGAFVSIADDASALYYNPAGMVKLTKNSILFNYVKWPADIGFSYVGMVFPLGIAGAFGVQGGLLSVPAMEITTIEEPEGTGKTFSVSNYYVGLSYARYFTDKLAIGLTGKFIQEIIADASSSMMAIDVGATYYTGFKSLRIGMAIRNFGSDGQFAGGTILMDQYQKWTSGQTPLNIYYATEPYPIPLNFNFGMAYDFLEGPDNFLTSVIEFQNPNDGPESFKIGAEYSYAKMISLRLGYIFHYDKVMEKVEGRITTLPVEEIIENLTAGIGFNTRLTGFDIGIDYSFTGMGKLGFGFTNGHRVSLQVGF